MKKNVLYLGVLITTLFNTTNANELATDTVISINRPNSVTIIEKNGGVEINVLGRDSDSTFVYNYQSKIIPNATISTKQSSSEWNLDFPFAKRNNDGTKKATHWEIFTGGLGLGYVNATGTSQDMDISMGSSMEIMWSHILGLRYMPWAKGPQFSIGFGIDWRNYKLGNKKMFAKVGEDLIITDYPANATDYYSRLKMFSLNVPLLITQPVTKHLSVSGGIIVNFNTYAGIKTKYYIDDVKSEVFKKEIHQSPVTCDLMGIIKYRWIGTYIKYSPCNQFNVNYAPKFNSLSTGIILFL